MPAPTIVTLGRAARIELAIAVLSRVGGAVEATVGGDGAGRMGAITDAGDHIMGVSPAWRRESVPVKGPRD